MPTVSIQSKKVEKTVEFLSEIYGQVTYKRLEELNSDGTIVFCYLLLVDRRSLSEGSGVEEGHRSDNSTCWDE